MAIAALGALGGPYTQPCDERILICVPSRGALENLKAQLFPLAGGASSALARYMQLPSAMVDAIQKRVVVFERAHLERVRNAWVRLL